MQVLNRDGVLTQKRALAEVPVFRCCGQGLFSFCAFSKKKTPAAISRESCKQILAAGIGPASLSYKERALTIERYQYEEGQAIILRSLGNSCLSELMRFLIHLIHKWRHNRRWRRHEDSNLGAAFAASRFSKPAPSAAWVCLHMVGMAGLEPATSCSQSTRAAKLHYIPIWCRQPESNLRPSRYECDALLSELYRQICVLLARPPSTDDVHIRHIGGCIVIWQERSESDAH